MSTKRRPWTAADDRTLRKLHMAGKSMHAIAKEMGRSKDTISNHGEKLGLRWGISPQVKAAAAEVSARAKVRRAELMHLLLEDAHRLRAQMWQPTTYFDWGGKDHDYDEREVPEPTHADKQKLMQATATAVQSYARLEQLEAEAGAPAARSMLERLAERLGVEGAEA